LINKGKKAMKKFFLHKKILVLATISSVSLVFFSNVGTAENNLKQLPPARKIPGLTIDDKFPNGCVDCHINMPDIKQDERLSTLMSKWESNVEEKLMKKAQGVAPDIALKGTHPPATESLIDIPSACKICHSEHSNEAPPFTALIHSIHLTGGDENHFLTIFQGECTYCHKLNMTTGVWSMPSGPEK